MLYQIFKCFQAELELKNKESDIENQYRNKITALTNISRNLHHGTAHGSAITAYIRKLKFYASTLGKISIQLKEFNCSESIIKY